MDALVEELKRYAEREQLSVKQVALKLGVPFKTVEPWFTQGKSRAIPSRANLRKIEQLLHPETHPKLDTVEQTPTPLAQSKEITMENKVLSGLSIAGRGKTIRDSVHMDVELTPLEVKIIDTTSFQRLRHIKQLGTANLVFPGATHTRFDHSLGTVAAAQKIIDAVNSNPDTTVKIDSDVARLIRVCALLHDVTHMPFGHTLEDEGFLFKRHDDAAKGKDDPPWKNTRWELFLGPTTEIGMILGKDLTLKVLIYLTTKEDKINDLEYPFVVDMVGNTVCADLIDYLERDTYYTGLKESFDPRFMRNLMIASYVPPAGAQNHMKSYRERLVLSLLKRDIVRRDVISEVMHLLRLRYSLAEKIYFNHAKIIASAMVIEAVQAALISNPSRFTEQALCSMRFGDDELLVRLSESKVPIAEKLVDKLSSRQLYQPVYMLSYNARSLDDTSWPKKVNVIERFRANHETRFQLERRLEKWNSLPEGSVIIYCPTEDMNLKEIKALCLWRDGQVMPLTEIPGEKLPSDAKSINVAHQELWKLFVFVERGLEGERELKQHLASDCCHEFQLPNGIEDYAMVPPPLERYIERWAETRSDLAVTIAEKNQLVSMKSLYAERSSASPPSSDDLEKDLADIRKR